MPNGDRAIITSVRQLGAMSGSALWHSLLSLPPCWWARLSMPINWSRHEDGKVPSVNLVSISHGLVYQRRLEAIKRVWAAQWHKLSEQNVPRCLEGHPSSGERGDTWPSRYYATWTDTWMCSWVDTWDKAPTMPPSAHTAMSRQKWTGLNYPLESPSVSETHVNRLPERHFLRSVLPGGVSLWVMYFDGCCKPSMLSI